MPTMGLQTLSSILPMAMRSASTLTLSSHASRPARAWAAGGSCSGVAQSARQRTLDHLSADSELTSFPEAGRVA